MSLCWKQNFRCQYYANTMWHHMSIQNTIQLYNPCISMAQIRKAIWLQEDPRRLVILYFANWQLSDFEPRAAVCIYITPPGWWVFCPLRKKHHFFPLHSRMGCLKCTQKFKLDLSVNQCHFVLSQVHLFSSLTTCRSTKFNFKSTNQPTNQPTQFSPKIQAQELHASLRSSS